ncbi:MAG: transglycosylase SLT domain-containing protein [Gemmatimonadota bacterium]
MHRSVVILALFVALAAATQLRTPDQGGRASAEASGSGALVWADTLPEEAREALERGRYWRASRILREYLAQVPEPEPATVLLAARAEAGLGRWDRVESLLADRPWLDEEAGGLGWSLLGRSRLLQGERDQAELDLARFLEITPDTSKRARGIAEIQRGMAAAGAGGRDEARQAFDSARTLLPEIADWIAVLAARAAAEFGDTASVEVELGSTDPVLALDWGWEVRIDAYEAAGDVAGAALAAERAARELDNAGRRASAWTRLGGLRLMRGDTTAALEALRNGIGAAPRHPNAVPAARLLATIPDLTPNDHLLIGRLYMRHGNPRRGEEGIRSYLDAGATEGGERMRLRLELGRALFNGRQYANAERNMLDLAGESGIPGDIGATALYYAGRAQYRQGRSSEGRSTLSSITERFPGTEAGARGRYLVADLDHDAGRLRAAAIGYRATTDAAPDIYESGLSMMRLAGIAWQDGKVAQAAEIYEDYRVRFPTGRRVDQATFWAARGYEELGRDSLARERYRQARRADPLSYYGLLAADALGEEPLAGALAESPPRDAAIEQQVERAMERLDLLRELDLSDEEDYEVGRLRRRFQDRDGFDYAVAEALIARGHTINGVRLGWAIKDDEGVWNRRMLEIVFPFPYREVVVAEARGRGLDPFVVAGLIRRESLFQPGAVSSAGAIGLMQVLPTTGRSLAREAGVRNFSPDLLKEPEINVHLGTLYLRQQMDRYDQRLPRVLSAYNAGPHRVTRWSTFPEFEDDRLFTERIPFRETREYVRAVESHIHVYRALYGAAAASSGP